MEDRPGGISREEKKEIFRTLDEAMCKRVMETIMDSGPGIHWNDIIGLEQVKQTLTENIIYPQLRPDMFTGLREPTRGILLYGPPGNGKTMVAKAVATEC